MTGKEAEVAVARADVARPFWDSLSDGKILLQRCAACEHVYFYAREWCPSCWSPDVQWFQSSGRGTVFATTVANVAFQGIDARDVPFAVGLVDLDEGPRVPARLHVATSYPLGQRVVATMTPRGLTFVPDADAR